MQKRVQTAIVRNSWKFVGKQTFTSLFILSIKYTEGKSLAISYNGFSHR